MLSRPDLIIGSESTEGPTLFGEVTDVALDAAGRIYVLDRTMHNVRSFTPSGAFIAAAGRSGRGPGDLGDAFALFHDRDTTLYVADRLGGVKVFGTTKGVLTYRTSFRPDLLPTDVCVMNGEVFVPVWHDGHIVHAFSTSGRLLRSFGDGFSTDTSEAVRAVANEQGLRVGCDPAAGRVYVAPNATGLVRAYTPSGALLWEQELPAFLGNRYFLDPQHRIVTAYGGYFTVLGTRIGSDLLLIQARRREPRPGRRVPGAAAGLGWEEREPVTYVLSASTGALLTRVEGSPILGDIAPGIALAYRQEPFPQVMRVRWREVVRQGRPAPAGRTRPPGGKS